MHALTAAQLGSDVSKRTKENVRVGVLQPAASKDPVAGRAAVGYDVQVHNAIAHCSGSVARAVLGHEYRPIVGCGEQAACGARACQLAKQQVSCTLYCVAACNAPCDPRPAQHAVAQVCRQCASQRRQGCAADRLGREHESGTHVLLPRSCGHRTSCLEEPASTGTAHCHGLLRQWKASRDETYHMRPQGLRGRLLIRCTHNMRCQCGQSRMSTSQLCATPVAAAPSSSRRHHDLLQPQRQPVQRSRGRSLWFEQ